MLIVKLRFNLLLIGALSSCLSCSTEEQTGDVLRDPALKFAMEEEIEAQTVLEGSYLVGFKSFISAASRFSPSQIHVQSFMNLSDSFNYSGGVQSISILAVVGLREELFAGVDQIPKQDTFWDENLLQIFGFTDTLPENDAYLTLADVRFDSDASARMNLESWHLKGKIAYAEPNGISQLSGLWEDYKKAYSETLPHKNSSQLEMMKLYDAYTSLDAVAGTESTRPIIAVMDSGIDYSHKAFESQLWENPSKGELSCGNDDAYGCNTTKTFKSVLGDGSVYPYLTSGPGQACPESSAGCTSNCCHGTHVAGIIASNPSLEYGGVCPVCRIMTLKIVGDIPGTSGGGILDSSIAAALRYVSFFSKSDPVRVINASFGKFERSRTVAVLAKSLYDKTGTIIIGAAGNEDANRMQYPAALDQSIAVSNVNESKTKASSSNFGTWVDIAAPGMSIYNAVPGPGSGNERKNGTSMASPAVAGVAGLLLAADPKVSATTLKNALIKTADPSFYSEVANTSYFPKLPGEKAAIPLLGSGIVDANAALKGLKNPNQPAFIALDRVRNGCGIISNRGEDDAQLSITFGILVVTILLVLIVILTQKSVLKRLLRK